MAKPRELNENWNVTFSRRDRATNEDLINLSLNWENHDYEHARKNLNTWLTAIGAPLEVVEKKSHATIGRRGSP
jgi:hypothetical protein